jgi:hypothetical protein
VVLSDEEQKFVSPLKLNKKFKSWFRKMPQGSAVKEGVKEELPRVSTPTSNRTVVSIFYVRIRKKFSFGGKKSGLKEKFEHT